MIINLVALVDNYNINLASAMSDHDRCIRLSLYSSIHHMCKQDSRGVSLIFIFLPVAQREMIAHLRASKSLKCFE